MLNFIEIITFYQYFQKNFIKIDILMKMEEISINLKLQLSTLCIINLSLTNFSFILITYFVSINFNTKFVHFHCLYSVALVLIANN